jgi:acyl-coenzyme A thioesterase PaaI-like protein
MRSPGRRLLSLWRTLSPLPGGEWLFAVIFSRMVPYSGSVGPRIRHLEPGFAKVEIRDRRSNRQHLGSVHAIALLNVAEQASGLAMLAGLPDGIRGIVTNISMEYLKKARGTITAVSRVEVPTVTADTDVDVTADCLDAEGAVVARATVRWRLGPVRPRPTASTGTSARTGGSPGA